jgi:hypothetical protein
MMTKPNVSKMRGFLLALASIAVLILFFTIKTKVGKVEDKLSPATQEISVNNITMRLINAHTEASGYRVELCYDLPDQRDWLLTYPSNPQSIALTVTDVKASPVEEGTLYWRYDQSRKITQRCQYLFFALSIPSQSEKISLRVGRLYAREPGQSDYCLETSQKMVERNYPVTIDCMKVNGFEGLVYVKFPTELLSMDPVFKNIFKDVKWDFYDGPWSFTFPVNPP